jgi:hypothetical protein
MVASERETTPEKSVGKRARQGHRIMRKECEEVLGEQYLESEGTLSARAASIRAQFLRRGVYRNWPE